MYSRILYSPQVLLDLWFLFLSVDRFLMLYTTYLTLVYALHGGWFQEHLSGYLSKYVSDWARGCLHCQRSKVQQHVHSAIPHIPVPARRFSHIHVDLVGPLPSSRGFTHLFTIVERTSRWPEAVPMSSTSAEDCARALISCWISRFGVPAKITSDRGAQFTSSLWAVLCSLLNISRSKTTSFHPQSNGLVERFHRSLKTSLRARLAGFDWFDHLPLVMLGLWTTPLDETGFSGVLQTILHSSYTVFVII